MRRRDRVKLSKLMSFALRHDPAALNLSPDEAGWVPLSALIEAIVGRPGWDWVTAAQVQQVIDTAAKQRFEIEAGRIRARYGHSRAARPAYTAVRPPAYLYHGTPRRNLPAIRREGLRAMSRHYVHLAATPEMAHQVGRRRDPQPVLLRIRASEAYQAGIIFGTPSGQPDDIYLVEAIPPQFIEVDDGGDTSSIP